MTFVNKYCNNFSIGFAIARRLAQDGAKVVISSRKQVNVDRALDILRKEHDGVSGLVCHVSKPDHRQRLFEAVRLLVAFVSSIECNFRGDHIFENTFTFS